MLQLLLGADYCFMEGRGLFLERREQSGDVSVLCLQALKGCVCVCVVFTEPVLGKSLPVFYGRGEE